MIRENLLADLDDPLSRHDRNLGALTLLQKKVKSGRFAKNAQKKEDQEPDLGVCPQEATF